jgi:hypothetical protein
MIEVAIPNSDIESSPFAAEISAKVLRRAGLMAILNLDDLRMFCAKMGIPAPPDVLFQRSGQSQMPPIVFESHWGPPIWAHLHTVETCTRSYLMDAIARIPKATCDCYKLALAYIEANLHGDDVCPEFLYRFHNKANEHARKPTLSWEECRRRWAIALPNPRRAIVVGNWFGDRMRPKCRESMQDASNRWGVEYVELTDPLSGTTSGFTEKLHLDQHAAAFDQVCYFDRDIIIRSDCPSPFDLVRVQSFGAVPSSQPGHDFTHVADAELKPVFDRHHVPFNPNRDHFNGGLYIFSPAVHGSIFSDARKIASYEQSRNWAVYEEGIVSLAAARSGIPLTRLSCEFNRCGGPARETWQPKMASMVQHYCGDHEQRDRRMDATIWQV